MRILLDYARAAWALPKILREQEKMSEAQDLLSAKLNAALASIQAIEDKESSIKAFVESVPGIVSAAVNSALEAAKSSGTLGDAAAEALADQINTALGDLSSRADEVLAAINTTAPAPSGGPDSQAGQDSTSGETSES